MFIKLITAKIHTPGILSTAKHFIRCRSIVTNVDPSRSMESAFANVDSKQIHYVRSGAGRHGVLLLPGALGSAMTDFRPQLEDFNKDVFTVVGWDPPGYGKSYPPERDWQNHFLENDAVLASKFMETIGFSSYSLMGWSDGGISALILAALYPEKVHKLVVWGANSYIVEEEAKMYEAIRDIDNWSPKMRQPFLDLYGEEYFRRAWSGWIDAFVTRFLVERKGDVCGKYLPDIKAPTLVIHGQKDPMVPQYHADHLHKHISGARLYNMPEGKHNLHLRYHKEFKSIVESFLMEPIEAKY